MRENPAEVLRGLLSKYAEERGLDLSEDFDARCDALAAFCDEYVEGNGDVMEPPKRLEE